MSEGSLMNAFVRAGLWERALDVMATAKDKGVGQTAF
jgi:pentatricopeptide repeat protein